MPSVTSPRLLLALGCSSLALLAGCGSSSSSSTSTPAPAATGTSSTSAAPAAGAPASSSKVAVAYRGFAIAPEKITVKAGTTITWTNFDNTNHNVITKDGAPAKFTSKDFGMGQKVTFTPTKPGVYNYLCTFHPASMNGTITVVK